MKTPLYTAEECAEILSQNWEGSPMMTIVDSVEGKGGFAFLVQEVREQMKAKIFALPSVFTEEK